jgi:hypothetical protein
MCLVADMVKNYVIPKTAALKVNSAGLMSRSRHLWARVSRTAWPPSIRAR